MRRTPVGAGFSRLIVTLAAVATVATLHAQRAGGPPPALAITDVTVFDGTGAAPAPNQTIVIQGAQITAVGPAASVTVPPSARTINGAGKFVIPGLIDGHVHWRGWTGELFLAHGVTSIVDLGNPSDWILAARDAEIGGRIRGPRIFTAAGTLDDLDSPASARAAVRALIAKGPDVIAVHGNLRTEELRAIADEAHKVDVSVVGAASDVVAALDAGLDGITDMATAGGTDSLAAQLAKRKTYVMPSLVNHGGNPHALRLATEDYELLMRPELRYVPADAVLSALASWRAPQRESFRPTQDFTGRAAKAGGRVVAGTGSGESARVPGLSVHQELELLVGAGLTPAQALVAATRTPAEMVRKDYKLGTIAARKLADLVVLDADPLADIRNTRRINTVIKNGQVVDTRYRRDYYTDYGELEEAGANSQTHPTPIVTEVVSRTMNQMSQVIHDGSPFQLIVRGRGFHSSSLVELNGRPHDTTFVSGAELQAHVPTERIRVEGTYRVTVFTPWPGGGRSNSQGLSVK